MRKNELIAKLQELKGNPQVVVWIDLVSDYVNIGKVGIQELTKLSRSEYLMHVRQDYSLLGRPPPTEEEFNADYRSIPYSFNPCHTDEDIEKGHYTVKKVACLDLKPRGKSTFDRLGSLDY